MPIKTCDKCNKEFKNKKNHNANCEYYKNMKFKCILCKFYTPNKTDYTRHLLTKLHYKNINKCFDCDKEFKNPHNYKLHISHKETSGKCINKQQSNTTPQINNITNNNTTNNNQYNNYTININSVSGNEYKYLTSLMSNNVYPLLHEASKKRFSIIFEEILENSINKLTAISDIDFGEDDIIDNQLSDSGKLKRREASSHYNELDKHIHLIPELKLNSNLTTVKLWLNPSLLTIDEIANLDEDIISEWCEMNNSNITNYLNSCIIIALEQSFMNNEYKKYLNLYSNDAENVYYKDGTVINNLPILTNEVMLSLLDNQPTFKKLIFDKLSKYQVSQTFYDFSYSSIFTTINNKVRELVNRKGNMLLV